MSRISLVDVETAQPGTLQKLPQEEELHLWRWTVDSNDGNGEALAWLDRDERRRYEQFAIEESRRQFLTARAGLRRLLADYLGCSPADVSFEYASYGKPRLVDDQFHFNLSHSGDSIVAVMSRTPVGIDVERVRPVIHIDVLARRIMTDAEQMVFRELAEAQQLSYFFRLWTRKEATVKLTGLGLRAAVDWFAVPSSEDFTGEVPIPARWQAGFDRCWLTDIVMPDGYLAAAACAEPPREVISRHW